MVKESRKTATAIFKGLESDCSVEIRYSSDDDLSDDEKANKPDKISNGSGKTKKDSPKKKKVSKKRRSLFHEDSIDLPMEKQSSSLHSAMNGTDHLENGFDDFRKDNLARAKSRNGFSEVPVIVRSEESQALLEENRSLLKRVTDLENEVSRLNEEVNHLKEIIELNKAKNDRNFRGKKEEPKISSRSNAMRNISNQKAAKSRSPKISVTSMPGDYLETREKSNTLNGFLSVSNRSSAHEEEDMPDVFKRLTTSNNMQRGRSMDNLHAQKEIDTDTLRSESVRGQSGRKYVRAAKSVVNNVSLTNQLGRSSQNLSRASSTKSLEMQKSTNRSTENLASVLTRPSIRRKLIGKRTPLVESAAMRWKASSKLHVKPPRERLSKRWTGAKGENYARLFLRGRSINLQGPSEFVKGRVDQVGEMPEESVTLDWVFGYRGRDCRNNMFVLGTGELCYFTAAVVVLYNTAELTQRHFLEHSAEIKSMALHPDRVTVATGQGMGIADSVFDNYLPHVRVWNSIQLETLAVIGEDLFTKSVTNLCFSKLDSGIHLCAIDESVDRVLTVWDWSQDSIIPMAQQNTFPDPILAMDYHPNQNLIITCSKESLAFWSVEVIDDSYLTNGRSSPSGMNSPNAESVDMGLQRLKLTKRLATFDLTDKPKFVTCIAFLPDGSIVSGDSNGSIVLWDIYSGKILRVAKSVMDGAISAIEFNHLTETFFVGSVTSPVLIELDQKFNEVNRNQGIVEVVGGIRTIAFNTSGIMFIGTTKNCVLTSGTNHAHFTFATMGHSKELWGLCVDWENEKFLTCGTDKLLVYWNSRQAEWYKEVDYACMTAAFHPRYELLAVGTDVGRWFALNSTTREIITMHADSKEQFNCMAFSPNGKRLAIGGQDSGIYIYRLDEQDNGTIRFSKVGKCIGHTAYITHLDWSTDSQMLRSNSGSHELLYWSVNYCKQMTPSETTANADWATATCTLEYSSIGIWPDGSEGNEINSADVSPDQNIISTGDDSHLVKIFNYPSFLPKAQFKHSSGHASHVSRVKFLPGGKSFVSLGGVDSSVLVWSIDI